MSAPLSALAEDISCEGIPGIPVLFGQNIPDTDTSPGQNLHN